MLGQFTGKGKGPLFERQKLISHYLLQIKFVKISSSAKFLFALILVENLIFKILNYNRGTMEGKIKKQNLAQELFQHPLCRTC